MSDNTLDISDLIDEIYGDTSSETNDADWRYRRARLHQEVKQLLFKRGIAGESFSRVMKDLGSIADKHEAIGRRKAPASSSRAQAAAPKRSASDTATDRSSKSSGPSHAREKSGSLAGSLNDTKAALKNAPIRRAFARLIAELREIVIFASVAGAVFLASHLGILSVDPSWPIFVVVILASIVFIFVWRWTVSLAEGAFYTSLSLPLLYIQLLQPPAGVIAFQVPWISGNFERLAEAVVPVPVPDREIDRQITNLMDDL